MVVEEWREGVVDGGGETQWVDEGPCVDVVRTTKGYKERDVGTCVCTSYHT